MSEYGKLESIRIKGIAIICMYVLHFFAHPDWILAENMYRTLTPWGAVILPMLSNFGHICVALFAFTSGYAMYIQREKYAHLQYRICKCFTFLIQYWFVIAAFMLYGFLAGETMPDIPTFLMQSVGIGTDIYAQGLNVCTAWYVFFFLVFVLLHPILIKLSVKNFVIDSFLTFIVLYGGAIIVTKQPFIGQEVLVANNLVTVRDDVAMTIDTSAIAAINMTVDFDDLAANTDSYLEKFNEIFNK